MSGCSRVSAFQSHNLLARMAYHHHRKASIQLDPLQRSHQHLQPPSHHSNRLHIRNKAQSFLSSLQCLQKEIDINCKENATIHCTELIIQKNYKVVNAIKKMKNINIKCPFAWMDGFAMFDACMIQKLGKNDLAGKATGLAWFGHSAKSWLRQYYVTNLSLDDCMWTYIEHSEMQYLSRG